MNRLPKWFKQEIPSKESLRLTEYFSQHRINTVCRLAACPNSGHCFSNKQATFSILGDVCTRDCRFCAVKKSAGRDIGFDECEPERITDAVRALGLDYVVITSVTRDDLNDYGAGQFAKVIKSIRAVNKNIKVEVLVPDFRGNTSSLRLVLEAGPHVLAHNIETVSRLYSEVRPQADYGRSLGLLNEAKKISPVILTKSSMMLGMGETQKEVIGAMCDLRGCGCDYLTLGQYLSPSAGHYPVKEFIAPEQFVKYRDIGISLRFKRVHSGPKIRSSYHAAELSRELEYA
jgi:lipoic acid synthetase